KALEVQERRKETFRGGVSIADGLQVAAHRGAQRRRILEGLVDQFPKDHRVNELGAELRCQVQAQRFFQAPALWGRALWELAENGVAFILRPGFGANRRPDRVARLRSGGFGHLEFPRSKSIRNS